MTEDSTRKKIIHAAIQIIEQEQNIDAVTVRKIAEKASIAVGLINYHFKSKSNLINISVREFINEVIAGWKKHTSSPETSDPVSVLKVMLQSTGKFLSDYPGISRISITNDLFSANADDI